MIFNTIEVSLDAVNNICWKVTYRKGVSGKVIITKIYNFPSTMTTSQMVVAIKTGSPSEETIEAETVRLAEEARVAALVEDISGNFLNVDKAFDPTLFQPITE